jgi:hypothetical protein
MARARLESGRGGRAMSTVVVSIVVSGCEARDFEVPSGMETGKVAGLLRDAYAKFARVSGPATDYRLYRLPEGAPLDPGATFAEAGIWDGAILHLEAESTASPSGAGGPAGTPVPTPTTREAPAHPVTGWRPLDVRLPGLGSQEEKPTAGKTRQSRAFVWKRLD